jgi:hypothetical protein
VYTNTASEPRTVIVEASTISYEGGVADVQPPFDLQV